MPDESGNTIRFTDTASPIIMAASTNFISIYGAKGLMVSICTRDGRVVFSENYDLDETAKAFWLAMGQMRPKIVFDPVIQTEFPETEQKYKFGAATEVVGGNV